MNNGGILPAANSETGRGRKKLVKKFKFKPFVKVDETTRRTPYTGEPHSITYANTK